MFSWQHTMIQLEQESDSALPSARSLVVKQALKKRQLRKQDPGEQARPVTWWMCGALSKMEDTLISQARWPQHLNISSQPGCWENLGWLERKGDFLSAECSFVPESRYMSPESRKGCYWVHWTAGRWSPHMVRPQNLKFQVVPHKFKFQRCFVFPLQ